jgi:hypothetical protein
MSVMIQARQFIYKMAYLRQAKDTQPSDKLVDRVPERTPHVRYISDPEVIVVFEGDRLASARFFDYIEQLPDTTLDVVALVASDESVRSRMSKRQGWTPDATWTLGRGSKVRHLIDRPSDRTLVVPSESPEDLKKLSLALAAYVSGEAPRGIHFRHFWHSQWQVNDNPLTI